MAVQDQALGWATGGATGGPRSCDCIPSERRRHNAQQQSNKMFLKKLKPLSHGNSLALRKRKYNTRLLVYFLFRMTIFGRGLSRRDEGQCGSFVLVMWRIRQ